MSNNPALSFYEDIIGRTTLRADDFQGGDDYGIFKHKDSLHTHTTAYGLPQVRHVCFCKDRVGSEFELEALDDEADVRSRYVLKLTAAWKDWRKFEHPVTITLNGQTFYQEDLFLENVCKGWPSQYFEIPNKFLKTGANSLELVNGSGGENELLLERVEILRHPDLHDFTVFHCPDFVNAGKEFSIGLHLLREHPEITVENGKGLEFLGREGGEFRFKASGQGKDIEVRFRDGKASTSAVVGEVLPAKAEDVLVGFDGDDIRHDEHGEMTRCLACLTHTQMGNFVIFRSGPRRNTPPKHPPTLETWKSWFDFCAANGVTFQLNSAIFDGDTKMAAALEGNKSFDGFQLHEPYLIFQPMNRHNAPDYVQTAKNLDELRNAYVRYLSEKADNCRGGGKAKVYYGDPSLLCVHMRDAKVDGVLCEPVSNSSLLYGAARATGKDFGAHIPADWYIGFPHDEDAARRFRLLLNLAYAYGGNRIYVESTAFKTNAFSRNDREDKFCRMVRGELRAFHKFTCADRRGGNADVPLALLFGNNESLFWRHDDRIAEMVDHENWDTLAWGKYADTAYRRLWEVSEAWLPGLDFEDSGKDESLTKMFAGTPYGSVDVALPDGDLSKYRAVAFTGWNTMTDAIYANLLNYVEGGGALFLCGCHLDTRVDPGAAPSLHLGGKLAALLGAELKAGGSLEPRGCVQRGEFLHENKVGKGKVLYYNSLDHPRNPRRRQEIKAVLRSLGEEVAAGSPCRLEGEGAKRVNFNRWGSKLYLSNVDWRNACEATLVHGDRRTALRLPPGETLAMELPPD